MPRGFSRRQSASRDRVSLVLGLFLALLLACLVALAALWLAALSRPAFLALFDDAYCGYVVTYVDEAARSYTIPTGLDPSVVEGVFVREDVRANAELAAARIFEGADYEADVTAVRARLLANVEAQLAAGGVEVSGDAAEAAQAYADEIMDLYVASLRLPGLDEIARAYGVVARYGLAAAAALALACVGLVVAVMRLHHHVHRGVRYVAFATGGAALMGGVAPLAAYVSRFYRGIGVMPRYLYYLCVSLVDRLMLACVLVSLVLVVATVALVVASTLLRRRALEEDLKKHSHRD